MTRNSASSLLDSVLFSTGIMAPRSVPGIPGKDDAVDSQTDALAMRRCPVVRGTQRKDNDLESILSRRGSRNQAQ